MGMDLRGVGGEFHFGSAPWNKLLQLAVAYGWEPAETSKLYEGGTGVSEADAEALARALEDALDDIHDEEPPLSPEQARTRSELTKGFDPGRMWSSGELDQVPLDDVLGRCSAQATAA